MCVYVNDCKIYMETQKWIILEKDKAAGHVLQTL